MKKILGLRVLRRHIDEIRDYLCTNSDKVVITAALLVFVAFVTFFVAPSNRIKLIDYREGDLATETVRASVNMDIIDMERTEAARKEAASSVIPIFDYNETMISDALKNIKASFESMRLSYEQDIKPEESSLKSFETDQGAIPQDEVSRTWVKLYKPFRELVGVDLPEREFLVLASTRFSKSIERRISRILGALEQKLIIGGLSNLKESKSKGMVLKNMGTDSPIPESYFKDTSAVLDLPAAINIIRERADLVLSGLRPSAKNGITSFIERFVNPNIFVNAQLTNQEIEKVREGVQPTTLKIQKNEVIVREGDRVTKKQAMLIEGIRQAGKEISPLETKLGVIIIMSLLTVLTFLFGKAYIRKFSPTTRDFVFLLSAMILTILIAKLFLWFVAVFSERFPTIPVTAYKYVIPVAASAMLVRFAINSETALIFSFILSLLMGLLLGGDIYYMVYCFIGSVTGAYKVAHSETKFNLIKASIFVGIINTICALSLEMIGGKLFSMGSYMWIYVVAMSLISGLLIAVILPSLSTLAEASGYLTDIKLMELANFNNPLLNKLALEAPGTYHHSRVVAQLCEVAAESIHANPLLSMVSAFYHDIGKIEQPEYFIENQGTGPNKHDELKPSMSKMIIISHVKDGVDMAKAAKVPQKIIDAIEQHHGTSLITFFYKKAKDMENPEVESIDESEYRYPGIKPQTREIGLLMLADAVEAASKSLSDPTPAQLQGVIQKVFNKTFTDGQLEDCEITLKDLHKIAAAFFRVLISIYKARIDYPELPAKNGHKKRIDGDTSTKQAKEDKSGPFEDKEGDTTNIRRIGIDKG